MYRTMYRLAHLSPESKARALEALAQHYDTTARLEYLAEANGHFFNADGSFFRISTEVTPA